MSSELKEYGARWTGSTPVDVLQRENKRKMINSRCLEEHTGKSFVDDKLRLVLYHPLHPPLFTLAAILQTPVCEHIITGHARSQELPRPAGVFHPGPPLALSKTLAMFLHVYETLGRCV